MCRKFHQIHFKESAFPIGPVSWMGIDCLRKSKANLCLVNGKFFSEVLNKYIEPSHKTGLLLTCLSRFKTLWECNFKSTWLNTASVFQIPIFNDLTGIFLLLFTFQMSQQKEQK